MHQKIRTATKGSSVELVPVSRTEYKCEKRVDRERREELDNNVWLKEGNGKDSGEGKLRGRRGKRRSNGDSMCTSHFNWNLLKTERVAEANVYRC